MSREATIDRLFCLLVSGDHGAASMVAEESLRDGGSADLFLRDVLLPLAGTVERLHRADQITPDAYASARRLLHTLARGVRDQARAREAAPSQFVSIRVESGIIRAQVLDPVLDSRKSSIIASEIRGAVKAVCPGAHTLTLEFPESCAVSSTALAMALEVQGLGRERGLQVRIEGLSTECTRVLRLLQPRPARLGAGLVARRFMRRVPAVAQAA